MERFIEQLGRNPEPPNKEELEKLDEGAEGIKKMGEECVERDAGKFLSEKSPGSRAFEGFKAKLAITVIAMTLVLGSIEKAHAGGYPYYYSKNQAIRKGVRTGINTATIKYEQNLDKKTENEISLKLAILEDETFNIIAENNPGEIADAVYDIRALRAEKDQKIDELVDKADKNEEEIQKNAPKKNRKNMTENIRVRTQAQITNTESKYDREIAKLMNMLLAKPELEGIFRDYEAQKRDITEEARVENHQKKEKVRVIENIGGSIFSEILHKKHRY
ncbi:MAG: hypothetical protein CEN90_527 [Parcubacteria group bacterium Licking1014_17]|nr:MAG: hypothetical protein CEN90_527 [Parcubacteria group bacterium Licking1014_17]